MLRGTVGGHRRHAARKAPGSACVFETPLGPHLRTRSCCPLVPAPSLDSVTRLIYPAKQARGTRIRFSRSCGGRVAAGAAGFVLREQTRVSGPRGEALRCDLSPRALGPNGAVGLGAGAGSRRSPASLEGARFYQIAQLSFLCVNGERTGPGADVGELCLQCYCVGSGRGLPSPQFSLWKT